MYILKKYCGFYHPIDKDGNVNKDYLTRRFIESDYWLDIETNNPRTINQIIAEIDKDMAEKIDDAYNQGKAGEEL